MPNNKLKISFQTPHVTVEPHVDSPNPGDEFTGHKPRKNVLFLLFSCRAFRLGICGLFKPTTSFPHEWNLAKFETGVQEFCAHGKKKKGSMVWKLPGQAREGDLEWEVSHFKSASFLFIPHMLQSKKVKKNCTVQNFMVQYKEMYSWNLFWTCVLTIDSPYKMEITCGSEKPSHSLAHLGWMLLSQWSVWIHSTHRRPVSLEKKKLLGLKSSVDVP